MDVIAKIQDALKGKKTYLTAAIGVVGALIAFSDHQIDLCGLLAAVWAAAQTCFIRAGITNGLQKTQQ